MSDEKRSISELDRRLALQRRRSQALEWAWMAASSAHGDPIEIAKMWAAVAEAYRT